MQFNIEVIKVSAPIDGKSSSGNAYKKVEVVYKRLDRDNKVEGKPIFDFVDKKVFETVSTLKEGDVRSITSEKNDGGYWQWIAINEPAKTEKAATESIDSSPARKSYTKQAGVGKVTGSNYETPEERAIRRAFEVEKQKYIVAQSSLTTALKYFEVNKQETDLVVVRQTADFFYNYVFSKTSNKKPEETQKAVDSLFDDLEDDIPA